MTTFGWVGTLGAGSEEKVELKITALINDHTYFVPAAGSVLTLAASFL